MSNTITMNIRLLFLTVGVLILFSCSSDKSCEDCDKQEKKDTIAEIQVTDMESALKREEAIAPTKEQKENHEKIVKKYGEQWDFCKCVVANDSITDAFEKGPAPENEEKLMARWDYVDKKCKELITAPNTTPEERARHDKRVMKCLKQNGLRK
jgi:hypothetical protein